MERDGIARNKNKKINDETGHVNSAVNEFDNRDGFRADGLNVFIGRIRTACAARGTILA
jgi:hypothetical protein